MERTSTIQSSINQDDMASLKSPEGLGQKLTSSTGFGLPENKGWSSCSSCSHEIGTSLNPQTSTTKSPDIMRSSILLFPKMLSKLAASIVTLIGLSSGILSAQDIDVAVRQDIDNSVPSIGDQVTYSLYLVNEGTIQATGLQVQSLLPLGAITNVGTNTAAGTAVYNPVNGIITWDVASLAGQDSVLLEVTADVAARGVFFNVSQVTAADQNDIDSNPGDNRLQEDDIASTCFSVPIFWYPGDEYTVSIPAPYNSGSGIIWYKNGVAITAGTEGATVNPDSTLTISGPGDFTFETAVSTCPATGCCAIMIEEGPYGEIGNYVWEDTNEDGIQDSGEPAIAGVTVYLYNGSGTLLDSTFTDANGLYYFDSLTDGDYQVQFIAPNGRSFTTQDNTTDELDSDAGVNGFTQIVTIDILDATGNTRSTVDINRNNYTLDAGIIPVYFDLALRKTLVSVGPFRAGDSLVFNLEVINQGNILATQVSIADYIPAGLTLLEANNWTADGDIARYNNLLSVAVGSSENVEVTFIVGGGFAGDVTNAAEITSAKGPAGMDVTDIDSTPDDTIDNDGPVSNDTVDEDGKNGGDEDDHDIEIFTVLPEPQVFDLALTKKLQTAGPYNPGDVITFEIEVYNQGNLDANFVQVSDYVPIGLTFLNVTNNWAQSGDTLRYIPNISLAAGDSTTITATYQINTDASGTIRNEAEIASTKGPNGENVTDIDSTPDEDRTNDGTSINDEINQDGKNGGDEDDHDFESFVVETQNFVFDLALSKSILTSEPYYVGQTITYGLTVSNQGNQNATQINLVDYTPAGLTLADANWSENGITGNAELNSPLTLSAGNDTLIYITYTVTSSGLIQNAAEIASAKGPSGEDVTDVDSTPDTSNTDPDSEDDHDTDIITAQPAPVFDLALTKNVISSAPFEPGDNITYAIQVINEGNIDAVGIEITDYIPAGLTLADINWSETSPGKLTYNSLLSLASGNSTTVNITFSIDANAIGSLVNSAEISAALDSNGDPVTDIDSTPDDINSDAPSEDDHDSEVITIIPQATFDLALRKTLRTPAPYQTGQLVTYDIDVINQGDVLATFVNLVDYVPSGLTLVANNNWSMAGANTATYNNQISLAAGTQTTVQISFTIDAGFEGQTIRNIAEISSAKGPGGSDQTDIDSTPDFDSNNDGATTNDEINQDGKNGGDEDDHDYEDITVEAPQNFDLAINKTLEGSGPFYPGDSITFSINVYNNGNVLANGVEITDRFPAGLTLADGNWNLNGASAATYTALLSLAPGTSQEISITFAIDPNTASGSYSNVAEITDDKGPNGEDVTDVDSTPDNNISSEDDQDNAVFTISEQASLGNFVWEDLDQDGIQDSGEPGISGVLVTLERPNGTFVASTTTDENGYYIFENLATGDYVVVFGQPSGYTATNDNQGGNDAVDSDADPITGASHIVNLSAGEYDQTIDAGFYLDSQCYEITAITELNTNICVGDFATFSAISSNDASIAWYYSSTGGAPFGTSASGAEFEVNPTTTTTYYAELTSAGTSGCPNVRVPVTVVVNAIPGTPTCSTPVEVCSGETINLNDHILNPVSIPGSTFEWHTANDPTSPLVSNPTAVGAGLYYLFEKSAAGCFSNAAITTIIEKPCEEFIDLSLIKIADNRNVQPDDLVTYTISVSNAGPDVATNVVIEDILPSGLSFVSSPNFTNNNDTLSSSFASLGVNQTITLTYVARVTATFGSIVNVAQVKSVDQTDLDSTPGNSATNNEDDDDDEIINVIGPDPVADLRLQKLVSDNTPATGDLISYTIRVTNDGPDAATNVEVQDVIPAGLTFISSTNSSFASGTVTAQFASIPSGETVQFTISATVTGSGTIVNYSQVTASDQDDPDSTPNNGTGVNEDDDDSVSITVTDDCNPTTPVISTNNAYICLGESTVLNAIGCNGTVHWSNGNTGASITVNPTSNTTYTATCMVNTCESAPSNQLVIVVNSLSVPTISASKTTICPGESVTLSAANCTGTVTWSNGSTTVGTGSSIEVTPSSSTSYTAICQVNTCVSPASAQLTVTVNTNTSPPIISASNQNVCSGESVTLSASNCGGTVTWSGGQTGASLTVSPTVTTTYTAICSVGSCTSGNSNSIAITVGSGAETPVITASASNICSGESVTLTASSCSGSITWNTGQTAASITVSPTVTTSYSVICTGTGGCSATATQAITVGAGQTPTITATVDTICNGESSTLTVSNCSGAISWSTGETTSSITVSPSTSTTYTVLCGSGSCSGSASQTISVGSGITPNISASDNNICSGESVTLTVDNCNQNVVWSTGQSGSSITVTPTATTSYVASCGNICVGTSNVTINVTDGIAPTISASATDICEPADITLTASGCTGTVAWSNGMTGSSITVNVSQTTTFTATCSGGSCVSGNSNPVTVNVGSLSTPTISASGSTVCSGSTVTLTSSSCSGTVAWSNGMTGASITVSPATKTVYTAICQIGGCSSANSNPVEVDVISSPNAPVISCSASRICPGDSLVLNGLGCEGTVKWSTGETGSSITVAPSVTTIYTATCMIGSCESEISAPSTINVGNPFPPQVSCDNTLICLGASTTLEAAGCVGTVVWSDGQTGSVITVSPATMTSYSAICKGSTCESETSNVVTIGVSANSIEAPTVSTLTNTCPVETVNLANGVTSSPVSGGTFVFRTGNSPNSPAVTNPSAIASSGTFYVFEKGNNGCYSPGAQIDVAIIACENPVDCSLDPATANAGSDSTICLSSDFYTLNGSIGGAAQAGTWTTSGNGTFENSTSPQTRYFYSPDDVTNGSVVLTLTTNDPDGSGSCEAASSSITLTINGVSTKPTISSDKSPNICLGDSVILTVNETAAAYLWSTGDTTKSITVKTPGEYTVKLFNSEGCGSLSSDVFTVSTSSTITSPSISDMVSNTCPATSVDLEAAISSTPETNGGEFVFHTGMTPSSPMLSNVSAMPAGTYYLFEKSTTGCYSNPSQVTVVINSCETNEEDAEVGIEIVGNTSEVVIGDEVVYTITVTNNGPNAATNVAIENEIPLGIEIVGNTPGLTLSNNYLIATIPSMAVNATETFVYTGKITKSGVISNIAKIIAVDQTDPIKSNNISRFDVECSTCLEICIATALDAAEEQQENGSYNVTFTSLVENCGNAELSGVSLTLDMQTMFGTTATYTMIQQPTVNSGSALVANSSFNGSSDQNILINTGSTLQPSDIDTVTWVINVVPNGDNGPFDGNSFVTGVAETIFGTTSEVSDVSNDGVIVDRTDATPTSVRLYKTPSIGIALAIIDTVRQADESLNVTYQAIVKNNGALDLYDVIVKDALSETYVSPITYSMVGVPTANAGSTLQINNNYDGDTDDALTLTGSTLAIGVADTIWFTVNVQPNDKTEFSNQATAQGTGTLEDSSTESVVDVSNTGYNPDTPGSQPTILEINVENTQSVQTPCIGSALYAAEVTTLENGSVDVTYKAIIRNCGNVNLSNVRLCDSLTADFGAPVAVVLKNAPSVNSGSTLTIDNDYDGINNVCILDSTNSTLAPGKTDTISWTINLTLNSNNGPFRKNVTVMATSAGGSEVSDISNDGVNPDPEGEAPTVLNFNNLPDDIIGIAKELVSIENAGENKFDVVFDFTLKNYGKIDFTGVQIQDNLALTFGDKVAIDSVRVFDASEGLTVNENFTGKGLLIDLLVDSTSTLAVNTTKMVSLFVRVDMTEADTTQYENMALAIGYHNGTSTDDQSTTGTNPDPDADATPFNNSIPTLIDFGTVVESENTTPLGIAKAVTDTVSIVDGSYQVTYTVIVKNYGSNALTNIQLTDSLSNVFTDSTDFVLIVPPTIVDADASLQVNAAYDGITDLNILVADSSSLAAGESDTLTFKVKVRNNSSETKTYNNTVYGSASNGSEIVTDKSNAGLNPDSDADNNPGNNNAPTPLTIKTGENTSNPNVAVLIPGGISPNGDGINDNLVIEGITADDDVRFKIFNRWGELVFITENYKLLYPGANDGWNGTANTGIRLEKEDSKLPDGTYFYTAESPNIELFEGKPYYNFITISGGTRK